MAGPRETARARWWTTECRTRKPPIKLAAQPRWAKARIIAPNVVCGTRGAQNTRPKASAILRSSRIVGGLQAQDPKKFPATLSCTTRYGVHAWTSNSTFTLMPPHDRLRYRIHLHLNGYSSNGSERPRAGITHSNYCLCRERITPHRLRSVNLGLTPRHTYIWGAGHTHGLYLDKIDSF